MITALLKTWIWAGIQKNGCKNISPARLTNLISLVLFCVMLVHLPLHLFYWAEGGDVQILILLFHAMLCPLVPLCSNIGQTRLARRVLIGGYASFISLTSLYLGYQSASHWFLILGFLTVPFLFYREETVLLLLAAGSFALGFYLLEHFEVAPLLGLEQNYQQRVKQITSLTFPLTCMLCTYHIFLDHAKSWTRIANEQRRSENLLLNVLPDPIAERLKDSNKPVAEHFASATVLFADIEGFSDIVNNRAPEAVVNYLNDLYSEFDQLLKRYDMEKIKTNGDEYMAVSGVPVHHPNHAQRACACALQMLLTFEQVNQRHHINKGLRIGLNSGQLIAGVIGKHKFSYDLWGDSVNLASRMESQGQSHKIQVSEHTYRLSRHDFVFEPRGRLSVRGMQDCETYWLIGPIKTSDQTGD
ncbi:adenylate/guanylate cyclase domain-containing protein [Bowmanella yangjiangensis]|uniref:Adenylate/guanylate cyclase domain-containing protein n=1 Tax=Bowmanella yangjiangensis TaxID=2811230 RepID=A0ABS3CYA4_9ALTE|nr:adenylate/guanylate cyclase domain-containing protein [Bowmanella yangjiangensis]MBN7822096.1 adenylate/guanylate cyclase domain-containing protein [Bowmanella yangjiangensis]